jgi:hypothetical protein
MMKLTANKTKMYELAGAFLGPEVPNIRKTEFTKYKGGVSFNLKFRNAINYNHYCSLYLAACCGKALLQIEKYSYNEDGSKCIVRETKHLSLEELRDLKMIREIPDAKAVRA